MTETQILEQRLDDLARRVEKLERGPTTYGPGKMPPTFEPPTEWRRAREKLETVAPLSPSLTTDPSHPDLTRGPDAAPVPQAKVYLVLSAEERAKGFVRPYRDAYKHVGLRPTHPIRDLTDDESARFVGPDDGDEAFVKFEPYPEGSSSVGRFWTAKELTSGCDTVTTMGRALSETYARDPKFYGSTYCIRCSMHRPVAEFRWYEMDGTLGPVVGS